MDRRLISPAEWRIEDVDPTDTSGIYEAIRRHADGHAGDDRLRVMDVTGGKKIMSATAAVAAWELRMPLCYVEGGVRARAPPPASGK